MGVFYKKNEKWEKHEEKKFEGNKKEKELETLLLKNPEIFPADKLADADTWIPLANQFHVRNHGIIDILATDSMGNLYVVECKIMGNQDMKNIRGQVTDYIAGLWSERGSWEDFQSDIKKYSGKSLDKILLDNLDADLIPDVKEDIKECFESGRYILVYAVDHISSGLREVIEWHNSQIDHSHKYPSFSLEIKKYLNADKKTEFIVTQNYPFNFDEIKLKKQKTENRNPNTEDDWNKVFKNATVETEQRKKILDFKQKLKKMVEDDKGKMDYGTGTNMPVMMPKFFSTNQRSAIKLKADGGMNLQFHLLGGEYRYEADEFKKEIFKIPVLRRLIEKSKSKGTVSVEINEWLPHKKKILQILAKVFVRPDDQ